MDEGEKNIIIGKMLFLSIQVGCRGFVRSRGKVDANARRKFMIRSVLSRRCERKKHKKALYSLTNRVSFSLGFFSEIIDEWRNMPDHDLRERKTKI